MKTTTLICCLVAICCADEDYYWRPFHGLVPKDALQAGVDVNGRPIFIGQVFAQDENLLGSLTPVTLTPDQEFVGVTSNSVRTHLAVSILCTPDSTRFEWIGTTSDTIDSLPNPLIVGGTKNDVDLNIGRVSFQGEVIVGNVQTADNGQKFIHFVNDGLEFTVDSYQVLASATL